MPYFYLFIWALVPALLSMCLATTDPFAFLCDTICWDETALAEECAEDSCLELMFRPAALRACHSLCFERVVPCRHLCHDHSLSVLVRCERQCARQSGQQYEICHWDCFTHNMMIIKAR